MACPHLAAAWRVRHAWEVEGPAEMGARVDVRPCLEQHSDDFRIPGTMQGCRAVFAVSRMDIRSRCEQGGHYGRMAGSHGLVQR